MAQPVVQLRPHPAYPAPIVPEETPKMSGWEGIIGAEEAEGEGAPAVGEGEGGEGALEGEGAPPLPPIHARRQGNSLLFTFSLIKVWFDGACERHTHRVCVRESEKYLCVCVCV
jgi:hypothetical protein